MADVPRILSLAEVGEHRYRLGVPADLPEGRDVVFSGQLLGQMVLASARDAPGGGAGSAKDARSVHAVFARAGSYSRPIDMTVESMHAGRTWASDTVTAWQDDRLLARGLLLLSSTDGDLVRHGPEMPSGFPGPEDLEEAAGQVFPGAEWRPVPTGASRDGTPVDLAWHRYRDPLPSAAAHQAVLAWATCGNVIGVAIRPHRDRLRLADAHRTISTGVISHTVHFLEPLDTSEWLLVVTEGTSAANGRIYGTGSVFTGEGKLVAVFHQDSMAKTLDTTADPRRAI